MYDTRSPEVLRCLMGYIVDLTLVMDQLFLNTLPIKPPRHLMQEHIQMALENYESTEAQAVHRQIREYVNNATFARINSPIRRVLDSSLEKVSSSLPQSFGSFNLTSSFLFPENF